MGVSSCSSKQSFFFSFFSFYLPQSNLSGLNLFDLKFNACISFSNRLYWSTIYKFPKLYSPFEIADRFFFLNFQQGVQC